VAQDEEAYLQRRLAEARERAASATNPLVRETHERFAAIYTERLANSAGVVDVHGQTEVTYQRLA
jgi:acyl-coenzyme A synthetase/AMP-(fatty) acid ligase